MQKLKWADTFDIAIELDEKFGFDAKQVLSLRFTDLHNSICQLENFEDEPNHSNEKILEAIQMAWLAEAELNS